MVIVQDEELGGRLTLDEDSAAGAHRPRAAVGDQPVELVGVQRLEQEQPAQQVRRDPTSGHGCSR